MTCNHPTGEVGWSVCDDCFHGERFDSRGYWSLRLFVAAVLLTSAGFITAALVVLAR